MKKILLLVFLIALGSVGFGAERVTVKKMNSNNIKIAGKVVRIGDTFDIDADISWPSDSAFMVVYDAQRWQPIRMAADYMRRHRIHTYRQFVQSNGLYTRSLQSRRQSDTLYLTDSLFVPRAVGSTEDIVPEVRIKGNEKRIPLSLTSDGQYYVITREMFKTMRSGRLSVEIWESDKRHQWAYCCYRALCLIVLPQSL